MRSCFSGARATSTCAPTEKEFAHMKRRWQSTRSWRRLGLGLGLGWGQRWLTPRHPSPRHPLPSRPRLLRKGTLLPGPQGSVSARTSLSTPRTDTAEAAKAAPKRKVVADPLATPNRCPGGPVRAGRALSALAGRRHPRRIAAVIATRAASAPFRSPDRCERYSTTACASVGVGSPVGGGVAMRFLREEGRPAPLSRRRPGTLSGR